MPQDTITLLVPGIPSSRIPEPELQKFLSIRPIGGHDIVAPRRGESTPVSRVEGPPDSIVRLEYESGLVEYMRLDQFQAELGSSRSAGGELQVPAALERGAIPGRGVTDWTLKALHVFGISPIDTMVEESAELIIRHFDEKLETGLFRLDANGAFQEKIAQPLPEDSRACLVFIHGTASSTRAASAVFGGTSGPRGLRPSGKIWSKHTESGSSRWNTPRLAQARRKTPAIWRRCCRPKPDCI